MIVAFKRICGHMFGRSASDGDLKGGGRIILCFLINLVLFTAVL